MDYKKFFNFRNLTSEIRNQQYFIGILLVAMGNILFSAKAILVKLAYHHSTTDAISLLAFRLLFSLPFYVFVAYWLRKKQINPVSLTVQQKLWILIAGFSGYHLGSWTDFMGLQYISAGLERLILYTYPTMVLILTAIFLRVKPNNAQYFALILTYLGIFVSFGSDAAGATQKNIWLGSSWIFLSAFTYSLYYLIAGRLIPIVGSVLFSCYAMIVATFCVWMHALTQHGSSIFNQSNTLYQLAFEIAIFATVVPTFMVAEGISRVGASNSAIIGFIGPVSMIFMANIFLGEAITFQQIMGTILVLLGVLYVAKK
jgi:drug/metabolite transporter (DMT)-like permease